MNRTTAVLSLVVVSLAACADEVTAPPSPETPAAVRAAAAAP
jgi:hypothetical protein